MENKRRLSHWSIYIWMSECHSWVIKSSLFSLAEAKRLAGLALLAAKSHDSFEGCNLLALQLFKHNLFSVLRVLDWDALLELLLWRFRLMHRVDRELNSWLRWSVILIIEQLAKHDLHFELIEGVLWLNLSFANRLNHVWTGTICKKLCDQILRVFILRFGLHHVRFYSIIYAWQENSLSFNN